MNLENVHRDRQRANAQLSNNDNDCSKFRSLRNKVNNLKKFVKRRFFRNLG